MRVAWLAVRPDRDGAAAAPEDERLHADRREVGLVLRHWSRQGHGQAGGAALDVGHRRGRVSSRGGGGVSLAHAAHRAHRGQAAGAARRRGQPGDRPAEAFRHGGALVLRPRPAGRSPERGASVATPRGARLRRGAERARSSKPSVSRAAGASARAGAVAAWRVAPVDDRGPHRAHVPTGLVTRRRGPRVETAARDRGRDARRRAIGRGPEPFGHPAARRAQLAAAARGVGRGGRVL